MEAKLHGFFRDDGTPVNPTLIPKPGLCILCKKREENREQDILCTLNRIAQQGRNDFKCDAYEKK